MNLYITERAKPPRLGERTRKLFAEAKDAGFIHLGWLNITILSQHALAGFANSDGSITLAFIGSDASRVFDPQAVDLVSHLEGPRKLTTTTFPLILPRTNRGLFKYSHPRAGIRGLLRKHRMHLRDLAGEPVLFVKSLADLEASVRDYMAFEEQARAPKRRSRRRRVKVDPNDPFAVIREAGTDGANYELSTNDIVARLNHWQALCSFRVVRAKHNTVDIEFETLPSDVDAFARDLYDFCPDLVDQGTGCVHETLEMLEDAGKKPTKEMQELIEGVDFEDEDYGLEILKRELQKKKKVTLWWD